MTFDNAAWAIDGARTSAALARRQSYAASGGADGVISKGDLKVLPLEVPGAGLRVAPGAALVLNRYQTSPNEVYTVSNDGEHVVSSGEMPPASASAQSHLVCVTIGDPQFSQVGHPWMPSTVPVGEEETFQYVRVFIIANVPSSTTSFADLGLSYPGLALARLDVPANTSTITSDMITDLRTLPMPQSLERIEHIDGAPDDLLNTASPSWETWPSTVQYALYIPEWAVRAKITGFVEGARLTAAGRGGLRVTITNVGSTKVTNIDESAPTSGSDRKSYNLGGEIPIPASARGTTQTIRVEGNHVNSMGFLNTDSWTSGQIRVRLEEEAT